MTDIKIENMDVAHDSSGQFVRINGQDELFQRAHICICARLGLFVYDRDLGSQAYAVDKQLKDAKDRLELVMNEALAKLENATVTVLETGEKTKIKLTINGESRTEELII